MDIHPHLKQQLKDMGLSEQPPSRDDWESFLIQVSDHYKQLELDQGMYERLLSVSSEQMREQYEYEHDKRKVAELMLNVIAAAATSMEPQDSLEVMCKELAHALDLPMAAFAVLEEDNPDYLKVVAEYVEPGYSPALGVSIPIENNDATQYVLEQRTHVVISDARNDPRTLPFRDTLEERGTASLMLIPLVVQNQVIGTLGLDSTIPREFTPEEIALAHNVAAAAGQVFQYARLYAAVQEELAERKKTEIQLKNAKALAEAANNAKSTFLATMSHELRTPLNSIIGYTDLLRQQIYGELNKRQSERVDTIHRNAHQLLQLINDILDLSKIETGKMELNVQTCELEPVIAECLETYTPQANQKALEMYVRIADDLPPVRGDQERLLQILANLVSNAVKFTQSGSVTIEARHIRSDQLAVMPPGISASPGGWVSISVTDTGIGIAKDNFEVIFDEFRQLDDSVTRQYEGTGLGLALTRQLVTMMNGYIWVESTLGEGSTFNVLLPVVP